MASKARFQVHVSAVVAILSFFLLSGGFTPASGEETKAVNGAENGKSSPTVPNAVDHIRKGPYLIYGGSPISMTVLWQTFQTPASATIEWGTTTSYGKGPVTVRENNSLADKHLFSYMITNLTPGTRYYYRVTNDAFPHTGSFVTPPPAEQKTLSFYGYGESSPEYLDGPADHNSVLKALRADMNAKPDERQTLLVHLGDYVWNGLNEYLWDFQHFTRDARYEDIYTAFSNLPFMGVLGSHEGFDPYVEKATVVNYENMGEFFRKYYPYPYPNGKRFYYAFDYGPVLFVVIDASSYQAAPGGRQTIDRRQLAWLKQSLRVSKKPWKIAMIHTPLWACTQGNAALQAQLTPVLKDGGVRIVLQGQNRYYSHAQTEGPYAGMTFLTLGGGGARLDPEVACVQETNKKWPPLTVFNKFHFARFDISGNTMTVRVIDKDGKELEKFDITQSNPTPGRRLSPGPEALQPPAQ